MHTDRFYSSFAALDLSKKLTSLTLPKGAILFANRAYTDYEFEDFLLNVENIKLLARRKNNLKR